MTTFKPNQLESIQAYDIIHKLYPDDAPSTCCECGKILLSDDNFCEEHSYMNAEEWDAVYRRV
jgi:hypothetical protein